MLKILASLAIAAVLTAPAVAQMPDFTNLDINGMNDDFNRSQNGQMDAMTAAMIQENLTNPYAQRVIASGACGSGTPEQLAYIYGATGGCSQQGFDRFNGDTENIITRENQFNDALYPD